MDDQKTTIKVNYLISSRQNWQNGCYHGRTKTTLLCSKLKCILLSVSCACREENGRCPVICARTTLRVCKKSPCCYDVNLMHEKCCKPALDDPKCSVLIISPLLCLSSVFFHYLFNNSQYKQLLSLLKCLIFLSTFWLCKFNLSSRVYLNVVSQKEAL